MKCIKFVLISTLLALSVCKLSYAISIGITGTDGPWTLTDFREIPATDVDAHFGLDTGFATETANGGLVFDLEIKVSDIVNGFADIAIDKDITNLTGIKWTDFHFELGLGLGDDFVQSTVGDGLFFAATPAPDNVFDDFTNFNMTEDTIDFFGGSGVDLGKTTDFWLGLGVSDPDGDGMTTFTLRQIATVAEPSALFLFSIGLLCILRVRRNGSSFAKK